MNARIVQMEENIAQLLKDVADLKGPGSGPAPSTPPETPPTSPT